MPTRLPHVVVSGGPGAGKSTVGVRLAHEIGTALVSKDRLTEALHEAKPVRTSADSLDLSAAAMRILWRLAADAGTGVVLDANWKADVPQIERLPGPVVQVFCAVPPAVAERRIRARIGSGERHPVHRDVMDGDVLQNRPLDGQPTRRRASGVRSAMLPYPSTAIVRSASASRHRSTCSMPSWPPTESP